MQKPDAGAYYRGKQGYNCAQAVLKAFAPYADIDDACLTRYAGFGAGQAPGGECGALFAAKSLLGDPAARQRAEEAFLEVASSTKCRDIRARRTIACRRCVQTAVDAVFAELPAGGTLAQPG